MIEMELRARVNAALKESMKAKEAERLSTLRLINAWTLAKLAPW